MALRLFLDSADPRDWAAWLPSGLFHGVTTNPTLLRRVDRPCSLESLTTLTRQALDLGCREVHLQAWGQDADTLESCGRALAGLAPEQVLVKVPISRPGAAAAARLIGSGIRVTFTACYALPQVLVAAALGADYIAPYLGRLHDLGRDGSGEVVAMQRCARNLGSPLRVLVASLRRSTEMGLLATEGLDTFTISAAVAAELLACPETEEAAARFEQDAAAG
jgi:transaldolase